MKPRLSFVFDQRDSDSPLIESVWRTYSDRRVSAAEGGDPGDPTTFISTAGVQCEIVVMKANGQTTLTVRGPSTRSSIAPIPGEAEFFGIRFKLGTFMPHMPTQKLVDADRIYPAAAGHKIWLNSEAWELPSFDNADTFIERLVRQDLLLHEPIVDTALQGASVDLSLRSVQRRFLRATGLTHGMIVQIERAKQAQLLLQNGVSILDTVAQTGYADQSHLTRSLTRLVGQTPAKILRTARMLQQGED